MNSLPYQLGILPEAGFQPTAVAESCGVKNISRTSTIRAKALHWEVSNVVNSCLCSRREQPPPVSPYQTKLDSLDSSVHEVY